MSEQNSFMPSAQSSFLAALPETKHNQVITGFDSFIQTQFCTPSFWGCKLCIGASVESGFIAITIQANTPFGGPSKSFKITNNVNFTWAPFGVFKVEFQISDFNQTGSTISFRTSENVCIKVPFLGWKCKTFSQDFSIPTELPQAQQSFLSAKADDNNHNDQNNSYGTMLLLHTLLEEKDSCNCG